MKLERIIVNNFRPFYDHQELDLTVSDEKPLILIEAMNDVGKTSFFKATQWCLYGDNYKTTRSHVNRTACKENDGEMSVTLIFTHDNDQYEISRSIAFKREPFAALPEISDEKLLVIKNGEIQDLKTLPEQNEYIQGILPKDASKFFLFDGEEIQKYMAERPGEHIKESIEMVLGIQELRNARNDLEKIIRNVDRELSDLITKKYKLTDEAKKLEQLREDLEKIDNEIKDLSEKISHVKDSIDFYDEKLSQFNGIKEKVEERIGIKKEIESIRKSIEEIEFNIRDFNEKYPFLLAAPLLKEISNQSISSRPSWEKDAISALLSSNASHCICGRDITDEIINMFRSKIKEYDGSLLNNLAREANIIIVKYPVEYIEKEFYELHTRLNDLLDELQIKKNKEKELDEQIESYRDLDEEINNYEKNRKMAKEKKEEYEISKKEKEVEYKVKEKEYNNKKKKLMDKHYDDEIENKQKYFEMCIKCLEAINYVIDKLVRENRKNVEELASEIFLKLTNAPDLYRGLEITENYEIKVKTFSGEIRNVWEQQPSSGQSQIIAMSFIAALNKYTAREAPVIIDTPIGRLDPIHKENLINYLPHIAPQVIVLYQPNEIFPEDLRKVHYYIASEWELRRDSTNPDITLISRRRE